jgi:hypothetical protein
MAEQRAFDLERRDENSPDLEHVVAPPAIDVIAAVLDVVIPGARPFAEERCARLARGYSST